MHRVLLIRIGKDLEPCFDYLDACARDRSLGPEMGVEFVHASAEAFGNLSQPLEVLRNRLVGDLTDALTTLLKQIPGRREGFLLDILIVTQHGEPLTTAASEVVMGAVHEIVVERFGAVFPGGAQTAGVGWRMQEIGILPGHAECKRPRSEMLAALVDHVGWVEKSREAGWPLHRMMLLDAATPGGISPTDDLLDQVENLLHLLLFSGIRRSPLGIQLFETASGDLVATGCIARLETPAGWVQTAMQAKMLEAMAQHLRSHPAVTVATPDEIVGAEIFEKPEERFVFSATVRSYLVKALDTYGTAAFEPLLDLLSLTQNHLRRLGEIAANAQRTEVVASGPKRGNVATVSVLATAVGGGTFAVAYLALGLATVMSAGLAAITAFVGAAGLIFLLPKTQTDETTRTSKRKEGEPLPEELVGLLSGQITQLESDLKRAQAAFATIAASIDATAVANVPARPFISRLASEELATTIFESLGTISDPESATRRWLDQLGPWEDILAGTALPDVAGLETFVAAEVSAVKLNTVLESAGVRAKARPIIQEWLAKWSVGMSENLEINHLKSRDQDGYRRVFDNHVLGPTSYEGIILDGLQGSSLRVGPTTTRDFYVLTAVTDIAPQAVLVLSENP